MKHLLWILALLSTLAFGQTGNWKCVPLTNAARTTTATSADQINVAQRGIHLAVTASPYATGVYTPVVQGKDPASGNYYTILSGTAINTTGTTVFKVYPGLTAVASSVVSDIIPYTWRVQLQGSASPINMTVQVGCSYAM